MYIKQVNESLRKCKYYTCRIKWQLHEDVVNQNVM